jgi:hypothetical protein
VLIYNCGQHSQSCQRGDSCIRRPSIARRILVLLRIGGMFPLFSVWTRQALRSAAAYHVHKVVLRNIRAELRFRRAVLGFIVAALFPAWQSPPFPGELPVKCVRHGALYRFPENMVNIKKVQQNEKEERSIFLSFVVFNLNAFRNSKFPENLKSRPIRPIIGDHLPAMSPAIYALDGL